MKITIAYLPGEERKAEEIKAFVAGFEPNTKIRKTDRHAPFTHIYMTTKKPGPSDGSK